MSNCKRYFAFLLDTHAYAQLAVLREDAPMKDSLSPPLNRGILGSNIWTMIAESSSAAKPSVRAWALQKGLDVRMIDRLVKGKHSVTLDKIEEIARACGLEAWHLLIPGLNYKNPPSANVTDADRELLARLRHLIGPEKL